MLRIVTGALFILWLILVLLGKGGFVHLVLLLAMGIASVEVMTIMRSRMTC